VNVIFFTEGKKAGWTTETVRSLDLVLNDHNRNKSEQL